MLGAFLLTGRGERMSPSGSPRAPLLWILLPFMAGLVVAGNFPDAAVAGPWHWGLATTGLGVGMAAARREHGWTVHASGAAVVVLSGIAGLLWLPLRAPAGAGWPHPPREVSVVLAVEQLFPPTPQRKTFSGLAHVVAGENAGRELIGQRVYFSAIRRVSVSPEISGHYRYVGLVEELPRPTAAQGFERYLDGLGVRVRLQRGQVREQVRPATWFRQFCARAQNRLERILRLGLENQPVPASVYAAMLLGEKALLEEEQEAAFMRSGVFHIFSISGLHVGVIALAILSGLVLVRVPPRLARVIGLGVLGLYVQVTGGSTPAERAFLMIAFVVAARVFRLPGNPLAALAGAALVTLLFDPRQLFSTGFQMSYSVVTALLVLGVPLSDRWTAAWRPWRDLPEAGWGRVRLTVRWVGRAVIAAVAITWAATLASTPSSIGNFGLFSPGALLANLVIVPLASLAIIAGFVALLAGLAGLSGIALVMNHAAAVVILVMDWLVRRGTEMPGMYFAAEFRAPWMGAAALVVVLGSMFLAANPRLGRNAPYWLPLAALAATMILSVKFP
ncbi:MAG: hypothetical protein C0518_02130 [Opitutus sp.]|nr:hypothetical protein [Opitutus sp.]